MLAERLAFLRAVDVAEADAFRPLVVQDFDGVAVEDGDDGAGEVGSLRDGKPTEKYREGNEAARSNKRTFLSVSRVVQ